ncbi:MAG TPA: tetratricopeptide repeat protein [Pyrinomonadaceae bacterium]|nr:tetratricopeptide repeat protein [Pyrinomonadaceae bacterium]
MSLRKLNALLLAALFLAAPFAPAYALSSPAALRQDDAPTKAEEAAFTRAQNLYYQKQYEQAATGFRDFLRNYPNSIILDLTLLWLGRSYIELNRIGDAEQVARQLRSMPDTPFTEIFEGELQAARATAATRPQPQPTPASSRRDQRAAATPVPTPAPTPRLVASVPGPTGRQGARTNEQPPAQVASARPSPTPPTLTINRAPSPTPTPVASAPRYNSRRRGGARRQPQTPAQTQNNAGDVAAVIPTPTPTPRAVTPPPTPAPTPRRTREQVAANPAAPVPAPTPFASRAAPAESVSNTPPVTTAVPGSQDGVVFTVKQVPNLALALRRAAIAASPGQSIQLPLTVTNAGNKEDQFRLETDLPAEFQPTFSLASGGQDTGLPILVTPQLARGQNLDVLLNVRVPETATDGLQRRFYVRAASQSDFQISRVADAQMTVVAAALAGASTVGRESVQPGETFTQTISLRNQGSAAARQARADFVFSPDFELVNANPMPFFYSSETRTAIWTLGELDPRESRDITVTLRALPNALASSNSSVGRGIMRTSSLPVPSNFDGPTISVGRVARARVEAVSAGLTATPGDVMFIPFVARNPGNYPESYELRIVTAPGAPAGMLYADTNGDGQHQDGEPQIIRTAQIEPRGGQYPMLLRVEMPRNARDRETYSYNVVARASQSDRAASEANTVLTVAAPRVRVRTEQVTDVNAPGDVSFYRLVLVNDGGGLAKNITVTESLPAALQVVDTNPRLDAQDAAGGSRIVWRVPELAPGDTTVLLITVRLRPDLAAGATITTSRAWAYQDTNGNTYQNQ